MSKHYATPAGTSRYNLLSHITTTTDLRVVSRVHFAINRDNVRADKLKPVLIKPNLVHVDVTCWHILIPSSQTGILTEKHMHCLHSIGGRATSNSPNDCLQTTGQSAPLLLQAHVQMSQTSMETSTHRGKATSNKYTCPVRVWPFVAVWCTVRDNTEQRKQWAHHLHCRV